MILENDIKHNRAFDYFFWPGIIGAQIILAVACLILSWQLYVAFFMLGIITVILLIKPEWSVYFLIVWVFIFWNNIGFLDTSELYFKMKIVPVFLFVLLIGIISIFIRAAGKIQPLKNLGHGMNLPVVLLLLYSIFTFLWSSDIPYSLHMLGFLVINILLYYHINSINYTRSLYKRCMWCWIFAGTIVSFFVIFSIYYHPQIEFLMPVAGDYEFILRYKSAVGTRGYSWMHPNYTAMSLNLSICITIGMIILSNSGFHRFILTSALALMIFSSCLTMSKGGQGSLIIMVYFLIFFSSKLRKKAVFYSVLFSVIFIFLRQASIAFVNMFGNAFHTQIMDGYSLFARFDIWKLGFNGMLMESAFFSGLGLGGFEQLFATPEWPHAHNLYLSLYFDFGVAGIFLIFLVLYKTLAILFRFGISSFCIQTSFYQTMKLIFAGGLIAIAVHGFCDNWYHQHLIWLFGGFAFASFNLANKEINPLVLSDQDN